MTGGSGLQCCESLNDVIYRFDRRMVALDCSGFTNHARTFSAARVVEPWQHCRVVRYERACFWLQLG